MNTETEKKPAVAPSDLTDLLATRLENGRQYLMSVQPENINVEDALEAFGFGRNGLGG